MARSRAWKIYKGLIFGCFDEAVPSLEEYLGEMKYYIDFYFDRREGGVEILGGVTKAKIPANWKMAAEQFAGDSYHAQFTHISNFSVVAPPTMARRELAASAQIGDANYVQRGRQFTSPFGHGTGFVTEGGMGFASTGGDPIIDEYEASILPEIEARLGADRRRMRGLHCTIFPNFSWLNPARTLRVWQPKGPNAFEIWSFVFVDKQAPEEVKEATRWVTQMQFGPAGLAEQDDGENWGLISGNLASRGPQIHKLALNYTMGLGHEGSRPAVSRPGAPASLRRDGPAHVLPSLGGIHDLHASGPCRPSLPLAAPTGGTSMLAVADLTFENTTRLVDTKDYRIQINEAGEGHPIFMIHGGGPGATGWSNFAPNVEVLSQKYRCIAVTMPGWGESSPQTVQTGRDGVEAMKQLADSMGIDKAAFVGNSMGGGTSVRFAAEYPARVSHLITMGLGSPGGCEYAPAGRHVGRHPRPCRSLPGPFSAEHAAAGAGHVLRPVLRL